MAANRVDQYMVLDFYSSVSKPVSLPRKRPLGEQLAIIQKEFNVENCIFVINDVYLRLRKERGAYVVTNADDTAQIYHALSDFGGVSTIVIIQKFTNRGRGARELAASESESESSSYYDVSDDGARGIFYDIGAL